MRRRFERLTFIKPQEVIDSLYECEFVKPYWQSPKSLRQYFITSYGRFISIGQVDWSFMNLRQSLTIPYYRFVTFNGHPTVNVHREVGRHFFADFKEDLMVCHIDENADEKYLNSVYNLFIGTRSDNMKDCYKKGRSNLCYRV